MRLTAVVPVRDQCGLLTGCLRALMEQTRPLDEILVVDNGSRDGLDAVLSRFPSVRAVREPRRGVHHARNRGLAEAAGDIVLFTDADGRPVPVWAEELERCFERPEVACAGGPTTAVWQAPPPGPVLRSARLRSYLGVVDLGPRRRDLDGRSDFLVGANLAVRKAGLERGFVGVFPFPPLGACAEDLELSRRLSRERVAVYEPAAEVRHLIEPRKTRLSHLLLRGFCFSAANAALEKAGGAARPLSDALWELPVTAANLAGRLAGRR